MQPRGFNFCNTKERPQRCSWLNRQVPLGGCLQLQCAWVTFWIASFLITSCWDWAKSAFKESITSVFHLMRQQCQGIWKWILISKGTCTEALWHSKSVLDCVFSQSLFSEEEPSVIVELNSNSSRKFPKCLSYLFLKLNVKGQRTNRRYGQISLKDRQCFLMVYHNWWIIEFSC